MIDSPEFAFWIKMVVTTIVGLSVLIFAEGFPRLARPLITGEADRAFHADSAAARKEATRLAFVTSDFVSNSAAAVVLYVSLLVELWKLTEFAGLVTGLILLLSALIGYLVLPYALRGAWIRHSEKEYRQRVGRKLHWVVRVFFILFCIATYYGAHAERLHATERLHTAQGGNQLPDAPSGGSKAKPAKR